MKLTLQLKPTENSYYHILMAFNSGVPLTCDQLNFLRRFQHKFSSPQMDTVCRYYEIGKIKQPTHVMRKNDITFLVPQEFKSKIHDALKHTSSYEVRCNRQQLWQFRALLMNDLIFLHGNHTLTGAPFFAGGVPHVDFFQWGNLYGVVKYEEILGETATDANILIHFEEKQDLTHANIKKQEQTLAQFAHQYLKQHHAVIIAPRYSQSLIGQHDKEEFEQHLNKPVYHGK